MQKSPPNTTNANQEYTMKKKKIKNT